MTEFNVNTHYSRANFKKLYKIADGDSFLDQETIEKISAAYNNSDEDYLKSMYEIILSTYQKKAVADTIFQKRQDKLMTRYNNTIIQIKSKGAKKAKKVQLQIEKQEKADAEKILLKLQTN